VRELLNTLRVVGVRRMLRLRRAHRLGWEGIIAGFYTTRAIQALFNVGFFDALKRQGSVDAAAFAAERGLDLHILEALCQALFALGILEKRGAAYALAPKGEVAMDMSRGWFDISYGYEDVLHNLEALLRREKTYGKDVHRRTDYVARGSGEIEDWMYFPLAADIVARRGSRRVLDLGCGDGTFLRSLCQRIPEVAGYGIDIAPDAIADGRERVREAGLQDRIQLYARDIAAVDALPDGLSGVDLGITFFVLHELRFEGQACVVDFLRGFRRTFPGAPLVVFEAIRPTAEEMRKRPGMAVQYFMYHDLTHQQPVASEEWRDLFTTAGFTSIEQRNLDFARSAIFTLH
jgi:SAM-dependent methyltransferase